MKPLPYSSQAEEAALGSVLINPQAFYEMSRLIKPDDFFIERHKWVWRAFEELIISHTPIDLLTVAEKMDGHLAEFGGRAKLTDLTNQAPNSYNALAYAQTVREHADRRMGIQIATKMAVAAYDENNDFVLSTHAMEIAQAARGQSGRIDTIQAAEQMIGLVSAPDWMTTGITDVDNRVGGLFRHELSVLAGRPGTGKTAVKLQAARRNAMKGRKIVLIDCEMTAAQSWFRMACGDIGADMNQVRRGRVSDEVKAEVVNKAAELGEVLQNKIVIYQAPITPSDVLSIAVMERPDILYIDTLKNLGGKAAKDSEQQWYDRTLSFLRINVAQAVGCHVQVLHHINRESLRQNKPQLGNLMFAGESDADAVFLLHRAEEDYEVVKDGNVKTEVPISWISAKARFGWTGETTVTFDLVHQSFRGIAREPEEYEDFRKDLD